MVQNVKDMDMAPAPVAPTTGVVDTAEFWESSEQLRYIRDFARSRQVSPWAVYGGVTARLVASVGPHVVLPPIVSDYSSLNLFVGVCGKSASGKAFGPGRKCFAELAGGYEFGIGSGEGVTHQFVRYDSNTGADVQFRSAAIGTAEEIDSLAALFDRSSSTTSGVLRKAWSGEPLGHGYVDASKAVSLPPHSYRLCVLTGVQPLRAQALLDEGPGGLPQRFLFLPANDPGKPGWRTLPDPPEPMALPALPPGWRIPDLVEEADFFGDGDRRPRTPGAFIEIGVPDEVRAEIKDARDEAMNDISLVDSDDDLGSHRYLLWQRAAVPLFLLEGRTEIEMGDWQRAEVVMAVSDQMVDAMRGAIRASAARKNYGAGLAAAERAAVIAQRTDADALTKAMARIKSVLGKAENRRGMWWGHLLRELRRHREYAEEALDELVAAGVVTVEWREAPRQPGGKGKWATLT